MGATPGEVGIEPTSDGVKVRCLTTWLLPNNVVEGVGFEPTKLSQRIYSPPQLATLVPLHVWREDSLTTGEESKQEEQETSSTDSYPSAPSLTGLPRRTDPPCGLQGVFSLSSGTCHLEGGFALRCIQRFSRPDMATQRCTGRHNWNTSGRFIPVLSY